MGDTYQEILVKKKSSAADKGLKVLTIAVVLLIFFAGIVFIPFLMLVGMVALVVSYIFILPKFDIEYEYLYVNGEIDIDTIYSKQKRKRTASYDMNDLEILAPSESHALDSYKNNKNIKIKDFTSQTDNVKSYSLVFTKEKQLELVKLEITQEIVDDIRRLAPRKVNLY